MKPLLLLIALALPAVARVGENQAQLQERYGKPVSASLRVHESQMLTFTKGKWTIECAMENDRCIAEAYSHMIADLERQPPKWLSVIPEGRDLVTRQEALNLLIILSDGKEWSGTEDEKNSIFRWGNVTACHDGFGLFVYSPAAVNHRIAGARVAKWANANKATPKKEPSAPLKGF